MIVVYYICTWMYVWEALALAMGNEMCVFKAYYIPFVGKVSNDDNKKGLDLHAFYFIRNLP